MSKEKHLNAKQKAYAEKQEKQGRNVVNWIFGILILFAIAFCAAMISKTAHTRVIVLNKVISAVVMGAPCVSVSATIRAF